MPVYSYVAYDRTGKKVRGTVEANSEVSAIGELSSKGLIVLQLKETRGKGKGAVGKKSRSVFAIGVDELAVFCRQFATMISAGVRIKEALGILASQAVLSKRFREKLKMVISYIESGKSLSEAFEEVGGFEPIFVNLIRAGEEGGALDKVMERLADFYESSKELADEVKASMRYPMFIGGFAVLVVFAMIFYIVPMLIENIGIQPTGIIGWMVSAKNFLQNHMIQIIIGVIAFVVGTRIFLSTMAGKAFQENVLYLIPPLRKIQEQSAIERFARTLAILVSAGVSLTTALEMAAQATGSRTFQEKIKKVVEYIKEGRTLRDSLAAVKVVPQLVYEMAGTGEATGKLDEVMEKVATFYEQQLRISVKKFVSLLEPMMIVFVGGAIAFIALSIYSAIFSYQGSLGAGMR